MEKCIGFRKYYRISFSNIEREGYYSQRTKNVDQPGMMKEMTLCEYDQYGVGMRYTVGDHQHIDDI